jgi:hypothetical protein
MKYEQYHSKREDFLGLLYDNVIISYYVALNGRMTGE